MKKRQKCNRKRKEKKQNQLESKQINLIGTDNNIVP